MALKTFAEEIIVIQPEDSSGEEGFHSHMHEDSIHLEPIQIVQGPELEVCDGDCHEFPQISNEDIVVEIKLDHIPGAPGIANNEDIVVREVPIEVEEDSDKEEQNENDARAKKNDKWNWEDKGSEGFILWVKERFESVPKHSGKDIAGLLRAVSYLEKLEREISKAMSLDLDGELDADKIEDIRVKIEEGAERLEDRIKAIKKSKKPVKKSSDYSQTQLIKEAQKITGVSGIMITVSLLISRIARVCINGMVSSGHSIEDLFDNQVKKYKLTDREQAETVQLLEDMGYAVRRDRGYLINEDINTSSSGMDWVANYSA
jgi:hypothetical protein